jgi:hypothetical protein
VGGGSSVSGSVSNDNLEEIGRDRASTDASSVTFQEPVESSSRGAGGGGGGDGNDVFAKRMMRKATFSEFDQTVEEMNMIDDDDEESYAEEMAYLLSQVVQNKRLEVVDSYGVVPPLACRKALLAILAALYIRQGGAANLALAGLCDLIQDSNFFVRDLARLPPQGSSTMLDFTVEAVCDRFELTADGERDSLLKFLGLVTPYAGAQLGFVTLQKIFTSLAFLCCHYAITQPDKLEASMGSFTLDADNYDDYDMKDTGMPSFKLLSQLLVHTFEKVELEPLAEFLPRLVCNIDGEGCFELDNSSDSGSISNTSVTGGGAAAAAAARPLSLAHTTTLTAQGELVVLSEQSQNYQDVRGIVDDFVLHVLDSIEVSRLSEVAYLTISKQSYSTISPPFWKELTALASSLFAYHGSRSAFTLLGAICKQAWHTVRTKGTGEPVSRDVGVKLVALGALEQFCSLAGENVRLSKIMGYQIRRLVVPCLIYNVTFSFLDHRVFSKVMKVISALWRYWRRHLRIEFAILCEQFIFKVMQATAVQVKPIYKMVVIQEVTKWFEQPHLLLEMFVNYDMDRKFVSHWNTFSYLVRTLCAIGRRVLYSHANGSEGAGGAAASGNSPGAKDTPEESLCAAVEHSVSIRDVHMQALEEVARMAKTLMDASGHAYLILQDSGFRTKSIYQGGGWTEDDDSTSMSMKSGMSERTNTAVDSSAEGGSGQYDAVSSSSAQSSPDGRAGAGAVAGEGALQNQSSHLSTTTVSSNHSRRQGSIKMRRQAHQESEALINKAIEIYNTKNDLKKAVDYLIKHEFLANTPQEIANFLRVYKNSFDPGAIGELLGEGGKNKAEEEYWSNIRFRYTRAVSFVEMDIEPALRLYLTGCGFRMPGEAQKINRFVEVFVKAFWQDNSGTEHCPFRHEDTVHLVAYAIIILNTDLHKVNLDKKGTKKKQKMSKEDFYKQLRGCDDGSDIDKDYLSRIYDNVAAHPIELVVKEPTDKHAEETISNPHMYTAKGVSAEVRAQEEKKFVREMCSSLRDSEDLLRSLSPFTYQFIDTKISLDLVSFMFESVWLHFHAVAEALLHAPVCDVFVKSSALDILSHALTCSIFLDLKVERMTLAGLVKTVLEQCESMPHVRYVKRSAKIQDDSWFEDVENCYAGTALELISKLYHLFIYIKDMMQESENYEKTRQIAEKFEKKAGILENNSYFVRQGELRKLSRGNRGTLYWFFLFSDHLLYAHLSRGQYQVHEQLPLLSLVVADIPADASQCSFHIEHPVKSFVVIADCPSTKHSWMNDILQAVAAAKKRHMSTNMVRHMSIMGRIEEQKVVIQQEQAAIQRVIEKATSYKIAEGPGSKQFVEDANSTRKPSFSSPNRAAVERKLLALELLNGGGDDDQEENLTKNEEKEEGGESSSSSSSNPMTRRPLPPTPDTAAAGAGAGEGSQHTKSILVNLFESVDAEANGPPSPPPPADAAAPPA